MAGIPGKDSIYRISGKWATEDFPSAKLLGLRMKRPEIYAEIGGLTSESEWLGVLFTGENVCEPTQACELQLYDLEAKGWSDALCTMIATLSGMEIRCPKGFEQATLLGLVKICNGALGEKGGGNGSAEGSGVDACDGAAGGNAGTATGRDDVLKNSDCIGSNIITRGGERIIRPVEGHIVEKYYPVWLKNRTNANP